MQSSNKVHDPFLSRRIRLNVALGGAECRNLYFLPDRLSEAPSAGSWGADISGIERTFERVIQRHVPDPLAEQILAGAIKDGDTVRVSVRDGELTIWLAGERGGLIYLQSRKRSSASLPA